MSPIHKCPFPQFVFFFKEMLMSQNDPQVGFVRYYYDGDGNLVKLVIENAITYYLSAAFQVKPDSIYINTCKSCSVDSKKKST